MHVGHLVVDSSAFIHNGPIRETAEFIYSCPEVVDEIKDKATLERLRFLPYELKLIQFNQDDFSFACEFAKKTGDYNQLSVVDLKVIAATISLQKQWNGSVFMNSVPDDDDVEMSCDDTKDEDDDNDDDDEWIGPSNIDQVYKKIGHKTAENTAADSLNANRVTVACMTSDFSIQNCLMQMGIMVVSPIDGLMIKKAKRIALRCHACFKVFHDTSKIKNGFCPHCGNLDTLKRVQYVIEKNGQTRVLINLKRPIKVKGTNQQLPKPRGGKHANNPVLVPDQKVRPDKQDKVTLQEKQLLTAEHIFEDPAYLVRTNPFAQRSSRQIVRKSRRK